jgi:hypothetical protein
MPKATQVVGWRELFPTIRLYGLPKATVLVLVGLLFSGARCDSRSIMVVAGVTVLWLALYAYNEATDQHCEEGRRVAPTCWTLFLGGALACVWIIWSLSPLAGKLAGIMFAGQILYSTPGLRLKRWWIPSLFVRGFVNPLCRIYGGAVLGTGSVPPDILAIGLTLHVSSYICSKQIRQRHDRNQGYEALPGWLARLGGPSTLIGVIGMFWLWVNMARTYQYPFPGVLTFCVASLSFSVWYWYYNPDTERWSARLREWVATHSPRGLRLLDKPKDQSRDFWPYMAVILVIMTVDLLVRFHT